MTDVNVIIFSNHIIGAMQQPCLDAGRRSHMKLGDPEAATIRAKVVIVITTAEEERDQATVAWIDIAARACVLPGGIFEHIYLRTP